MDWPIAGSAAWNQATVVPIFTGHAALQQNSEPIAIAIGEGEWSGLVPVSSGYLVSNGRRLK
jgi:hypothetical protein